VIRFPRSVDEWTVATLDALLRAPLTGLTCAAMLLAFLWLKAHRV
jgi:hypothetical protein